MVFYRANESPFNGIDTAIVKQHFFTACVFAPAPRSRLPLPLQAEQWEQYLCIAIIDERKPPPEALEGLFFQNNGGIFTLHYI